MRGPRCSLHWDRPSGFVQWEFSDDRNFRGYGESKRGIDAPVQQGGRRMRVHVRVSLVALLICASVAVAAPAAQAFGIESFYAANCKTSACNASSPNSEYFTQAAGHPFAGITDFKLKTIQVEPGVFVPEGSVQTVRTDVGVGVSTNPEAVTQCSVANFESTEVEPA